MAVYSGFVYQERQSSNRLLLFNRSNYGYWKVKMKIFIQASDYKICGIIVSDPYTPIKIINNILNSKAKSEWNENDERMA